MSHPAAPAPGPSSAHAPSNGGGAPPEEPDPNETELRDEVVVEGAPPGEGDAAEGAESSRPAVPLNVPDLSDEELPTGRPGPYVDRSAEIPIDLDEETAAPRVVPPRRGIVTFLVVVFTMLAAFVTGLYVFNNMVMPRLIHRSGEVQVPDLSNLNYDQAEQALKPLGLVLSRAGERFDPSVPRGFILTQDPPSETPVRGRKRIMVVVSLGEEFSSVPSLFGESLRSARFLLQRSGLRVSGITRAPSDEVGDGLVAGTDPPAEAVLPRNATVAVLVSTGSGPEQYVMPELLGREIQGVRRHLESLGFRVVTPPAAPSIGAIVFQDPAPGSRIDVDTPINLQAMGRVIR